MLVGCGRPRFFFRVMLFLVEDVVTVCGKRLVQKRYGLVLCIQKELPAVVKV